MSGIKYSDTEKEWNVSDTVESDTENDVNMSEHNRIRRRKRIGECQTISESATEKMEPSQKTIESDVEKD